MKAAIDFSAPKHDRQPVDLYTLSADERDRMPVATVRVGRTWQILSRYGDDIWHLPVDTTNLSANGGRIHFNKIPPNFGK